MQSAYFQMADMKKILVYVLFHIRRKLHWKHTEWAQQISVTMPRRWHKRFSGFLDSNASKHQLKAVDVPVVPPEVAQGMAWLKFANPKRTPTTYHFGDRWQFRPLIWKVQANSMEGLIKRRISVVCSSFALRQADAATCSCAGNCHALDRYVIFRS